MGLDRRAFLGLVAGGAVGTMFTPIPWKMLDDVSIWTQNWPWIPTVNVTPYNVAGVGEVDKTQDLYYLSANYDVTSKFNVGAGYYINKVKDYSGVPQTAVLNAKNAGNNEYTSLVLDYKWTKAFDFYFGYMHAMNTGGQAVGFLANAAGTTANENTNATYGLGMRYKF